MSRTKPMTFDEMLREGAGIILFVGFMLLACVLSGLWEW